MWGIVFDHVKAILTDSAAYCNKAVSFQGYPPPKIEDHLDNHPAYSFYKAAHIFDSWQLGIPEHDITEYHEITGLPCPTPDLHEEC